MTPSRHHRSASPVRAAPADATPARPSFELLDHRYELLEPLGEGTTGVVYKARQRSLGRLVAIKVLRPAIAADPTWVRRFVNEARVCAHLRHASTVRLFDVGRTEDGGYFMAMELLEGQSLRAAIEQRAPMPPERVLWILQQCCASLAEAHAFGVVHRDIKPDNLFLVEQDAPRDLVKVLDFSVAKLCEARGGVRTEFGVVFGTPAYMAPEQGLGEVDARADLYALGVVAYELLAGRPPFAGPNPLAVLQLHARVPAPPLPAGLPPIVVALIGRALEKDPAHRFQSAHEMRAACHHALRELAAAPIAAADANRHHRAYWTAALLGGVALGELVYIVAGALLA